MIRTIPPKTFDMSVVIQWPASYTHSFAARSIEIWLLEDKTTTQIKTVSSMSIYCDASTFVWADLEMWADEDGHPILDGQPVIRDNQIITKAFTAVVTQMLSVASARHAYTQGSVKSPMTTGPVRMKGL